MVVGCREAAPLGVGPQGVVSGWGACGCVGADVARLGPLQAGARRAVLAAADLVVPFSSLSCSAMACGALTKPVIQRAGAKKAPDSPCR